MKTICMPVNAQMAKALKSGSKVLKGKGRKLTDTLILGAGTSFSLGETACACKMGKKKTTKKKAAKKKVAKKKPRKQRNAQGQFRSRR